jgi:septal ring factor EnvC (AmiA/AmiB activator)
MPDAQPQTEESGLKKLLDSVSGSKGEASSWPVTVFLLSFFVIVLSILGIKLALTKRKAADLARKLREQEELNTVAKENEKLADSAESRADAQAVIKELETEISGLKDEITASKVTHEEYVKELQSVSSWDDIVVVDARTPNV